MTRCGVCGIVTGIYGPDDPGHVCWDCACQGKGPDRVEVFHDDTTGVFVARALDYPCCRVSPMAKADAVRNAMLEAVAAYKQRNAGCRPVGIMSNLDVQP